MAREAPCALRGLRPRAPGSPRAKGAESRARDPFARMLAVIALALGLTGLLLGAWSTYRTEEELRDLRRAVQRATAPRPNMPLPPTLDPGD